MLRAIAQPEHDATALATWQHLRATAAFCCREVLTQCACAFLLQGLDFYAESAGVAVWCGSLRSSWVVLMYTRALDRRCSCVHALWSEGLSCFLCCGPKFRYLNSIIIFCFSCARLCWFEVLSTHPQRTRRVGVCTRVIIACRVCNYVVSSRD